MIPFSSTKLEARKNRRSKTDRLIRDDGIASLAVTTNSSVSTVSTTSNISPVLPPPLLSSLSLSSSLSSSSSSSSSIEKHYPDSERGETITTTTTNTTVLGPATTKAYDNNKTGYRGRWAHSSQGSAGSAVSFVRDRLSPLRTFINSRNAGLIGCSYVAIILLVSISNEILRGMTTSMSTLSPSAHLSSPPPSTVCYTSEHHDDYYQWYHNDENIIGSSVSGTKLSVSVTPSLDHQQQQQRLLRRSDSSTRIQASQRVSHHRIPILYNHDGRDRFEPLPRNKRWKKKQGMPPHNTSISTIGIAVKSSDTWTWPTDIVHERTKLGDKRTVDGSNVINVPERLWYIRGIPYDLNDFIYKHPGGYRYIMNSANRDITELFEAHHIGTTAINTLQRYRFGLHNQETVGGSSIGNTPFPYPSSSSAASSSEQWPSYFYNGHSSSQFHALKIKIRENFDLNHLKEPSTEYTICFWLTVVAHALLYWACFAHTATSSNEKKENSNDTHSRSDSLVSDKANGSQGKPNLEQKEREQRTHDFINVIRTHVCNNPWVLHICLALTGVWLGGFAHNGLHMWSRRKPESLLMYFLASNNPFRWMHNHIMQHHVYTNTSFDSDKKTVWECQRWIKTMPWMVPIAVSLGTFLIGIKSSFDKWDRYHIASLTRTEQLVPFIIFVSIMVVGIRCQGLKSWTLRYMFTLSIMSAYTFILFQVSHYQPEILDGDSIHATVDDWGEYQLKTTWGWNLLDRPLLNMFCLNLNLQPQHHLFPAIHHSKLRLITPLIQDAYPGLMTDHSIIPMVFNMFKILLGLQCIQQR